MALTANSSNKDHGNDGSSNCYKLHRSIDNGIGCVQLQMQSLPSAFLEHCVSKTA